MRPITVLMYHGIGGPGPDSPAADPHYSVAAAAFVAQLDAIAARGQVPGCVRDTWPRAASDDIATTCLTFDDGLASNAWAAEQLAARGASADFFVNPSTVGTPGFLNWPTLRRMAAAGMSIQSHGMTHRYLNELDAASVSRELSDSRRAIEDGIGEAVTVYAPAGGRMPVDFAARARDAGYDVICSSRVGLWRPPLRSADRPVGRPVGACLEVPRFAMLAGTGLPRFEAWIEQRPREMWRQTLRYQTLALSKRLLGNHGHERLRGLFVRTGPNGDGGGGGDGDDRGATR